MAYDSGIATPECSRQFTSSRFGIRLNSTQQFVLIYEWRAAKVVSALTTHISRLEAIELASDGAFESCALAEHSNNISGRRRRVGATSSLIEDDHIKLTMSIKGISVPTNSDAVILDLYMGSLDTWLLVSDTCQVITPTD